MKPRQIIIFTILVAFSLIGIGSLIGNSVKHKLQAGLVDNYSQEEQLIGRQVAGTLQSKVQNVQNYLSVLALDQSVESSNPQVCNQALGRAIANVNIGIGNLGRVNKQGIFYCSINKALLGVPASKLGPYVPQLINDPRHQPVMSRQIMVPNVSGYVVALHVPVYDTSHNFVGTIGGAIYLNQLASSYLDTIKFAQTGYASLQDDNGDILYSHTKSRVGKNYFSPAIQTQNAELKEINKGILAAHQGKSSIVRYTNSAGVQKIASITPVTMAPHHRWIVIVNVPLSEISSVFIHTGLNRTFDVLAAILCLSVLLIAGLMIFAILRDARLKNAEDQFISIVSHQLRTPLTSIRLFSEMLTKGQVGKLSAKQDDYISKIHISTIRMIRLVGDILNVSRLELNRLKVEPVPTDLADLIQNYIDEVAPLAQERGATITYHHPQSGQASINLDPTLFGQVIHNLLTNAIRYSKSPGGIVDISLTKTSTYYELAVADNGIGIPQKAQEHIFDRFYRAPNAISAVGEGTGLGLYLVKLILEVGNCGIRVVSKENKGTTFYVKISLSGMSAKAGEKSLK